VLYKTKSKWCPSNTGKPFWGLYSLSLHLRVFIFLFLCLGSLPLLSHFRYPQAMALPSQYTGFPSRACLCVGSTLTSVTHSTDTLWGHTFPLLHLTQRLLARGHICLTQLYKLNTRSQTQIKPTPGLKKHMESVHWNSFLAFQICVCETNPWRRPWIYQRTLMTQCYRTWSAQSLDSQFMYHDISTVLYHAIILGK
jgi:hypothetical protein